MTGNARWWLILALAMAGCMGDPTVECADGRICPVGTICVEDPDGCVFQDQLDSCRGRPDGDVCTIGGATGGICVGERCVRPACGDGYVDASEDCDPPGDVAMTCTDVGYYQDGPVHCTSCQHDFTDCVGRCTDGIVNGPEYCEGLAAPPGSSCLDFGYDVGSLACAVCAPDLERCLRLGWTHSAPGQSSTFNDVWSASDGVAYAVGDDGAISRFEGVWADESIATDLPFMAVWGTSSTDVHAVGAGGLTAHRDASGWTVVDTGATDYRGVWASSPDDVWAVSLDGHIHHNDGTAWTDVATSAASQLYAIWGTAANDIYATGISGTILHYDGSTWTPETSGVSEGLAHIWGTGATDIWILGANTTVLHSDGTTWATMPSPTFMTYVYALAGTGPDDLWVGGINGISHWDGERWTAQPSPAVTSIRGIAVRGPGDVLAVGVGGIGLRYGGAGFYPSVTIGGGSPGLVRGITARADDDIVAVDGTQAWRFDGSTWVTMSIPAITPRDAWYAPDGTLFVAGDSNARYTTSWTTDPVDGIYRGIWGTSSTDVYAAGATVPNQAGMGMLAHFDGTSWSTEIVPFATRALHDVWGTASGDLHVAGQGVVAHREGTTWTTYSSGAARDMVGIWLSGPDDGWAVGSDSVVMHWDGTAWTVSPVPFAGDLEAVWGTGPDDVFAAGNGEHALHFDGTAWTKLRLPAGVEVGGIGGTARQIVFGSETSAVHRLERLAPW